MKVLLVNGSPRKEGCIFTALTEVVKLPTAEGEARTDFIRYEEV